MVKLLMPSVVAVDGDYSRARSSGTDVWIFRPVCACIRMTGFDGHNEALFCFSVCVFVFNPAENEKQARAPETFFQTLLLFFLSLLGRAHDNKKRHCNGMEHRF